MLKFAKNYGLLVLMAAGFVTVIALSLMVEVKPQSLPSTPLQVVKSDGSFVIYTAEVARTPEEINMGLMFRKELAANHGMIFFVDPEREVNFWMKNTLIPLDMLFIGADGVIKHIHPMAKPHDLTQIPSLAPVKAVLEINGGEAQKNGIMIGDSVKHEILGNMTP
ncbi:MAG: DUF192 domain-containing protein [Alphaproteobacteria bacterium]|jgi:uncharacterized membrane protein (UPF0127 family)|nr:DUF192 domain-containing protein [Alphaproteobacteria bacterium]QQS56497.1 MAG: DUF192 domain-containing protein [Alphaproteobacteria bacterium]